MNSPTYIPAETGRKLNVVCTFNLRPASTGIVLYQKFSTKRPKGLNQVASWIFSKKK